MNNTLRNLLCLKTELKNAKQFNKVITKPIDFLDRIIIQAIQQNLYKTPKPVHDTYILRNTILETYDKKHLGFNEYQNETPYNKTLLWGAMFAVLKEVLLNKESNSSLFTLRFSEDISKHIKDIDNLLNNVYNGTPVQSRIFIEENHYSNNIVCYTLKQQPNVFYIQKPNKNLIMAHRISDKQIKAIEQLKTIFTYIASKCTMRLTNVPSQITNKQQAKER